MSAAGIAVFVAATLSAQTGAQAPAVPNQNDTPATYCDRVRPNDACRAYDVLGSWDSAGDRASLYTANELAERAVTARPGDPVGWHVLGLIRIADALAGLPSKGGPLMPLGTLQTDGAQRAFRRAAELAPGWRAPHTEMARAIRTFGHTRAEDATIAALGAAAEAGRLDPAGALLLAGYALDAGDAKRALALAAELRNDTALSAAADFLAARAYYQLGAFDTARSLYYRGAAAARSAEVWALWEENLAWVADTLELDELRSLETADRGGWLREFWGRRDIADARAPGERLAEHFRRIEYALRHYRLELPRGKRRFGVVGAPLSSPSPSEETGGPGARAEEVDETTASMAEGAERLFGPTSYLRAYTPSQALIDDRGIIYIRHGPPDQVAIAPSAGANESWRYDRGREPLIFHFADAAFDGSSGATALVPSLGGDPAILQSRCGFDHELCLLGMRVTKRSPASPLALQRQYERGLASIRRGTTTDSYPLRYDEELHPVNQIYGLTTTRSGVILIVFAIPGDHIEPTRRNPAGGYAYRLRTRVIVVPRPDGSPREVDTTRTFGTRTRLGSGEYLMGTLEIPALPGTYSVTVVQEADSARGAAMRLSEVRVADAARPLSISDIVLGAGRHRFEWAGPGRPVPLNPINAFAPGERVELYYQVLGLRAGTAYTTQVELLRSDAAGDRDERPLVALTFSEPVSGSRVEASRSIDASRLEPGRYRLRVTVQQAGVGRVAQETILVLRER